MNSNLLNSGLSRRSSTVLAVAALAAVATMTGVNSNPADDLLFGVPAKPEISKLPPLDPADDALFGSPSGIVQPASAQAVESTPEPVVVTPAVSVFTPVARTVPQSTGAAFNVYTNNWFNPLVDYLKLNGDINDALYPVASMTANQRNLPKLTDIIEKITGDGETTAALRTNLLDHANALKTAFKGEYKLTFSKSKADTSAASEF